LIETAAAMTRSVLFQIHWFLGITAGLVLALMGVTGATMSFENEIMAALSPGVVRMNNPGTAALSPDALVATASAQRGGLGVNALVLSGDPGKAAQVAFDPAPGRNGRGETSYIDPYSGKLLGHARGEETFRFLRRLHRWMALPGDGNGIGRIITGIAALSLIYFALSGLYLRWPRKPLDWRSWFVLDLRMSGRNLYRALHAVIGGWVLVFYLLSALTGLWWSYDWYRQSVVYALTGKAAEQERGEKEEGAQGTAPVLAPAWASFQQASGGRFETVRITIPKGGKPVDFRALVPAARHDRMTDNYRIDAQSGEVVKSDLYARRKLGAVITTSVYELHRGAFFGLIGRIIMMITSLTMPLFFVTGLLLYFARRRKSASCARWTRRCWPAASVRARRWWSMPARPAGPSAWPARRRRLSTMRRWWPCRSSMRRCWRRRDARCWWSAPMARARRPTMRAALPARRWRRLLLWARWTMPCWRWATANIPISAPLAIRSITGCIRAGRAACST
jgi:sulfite reductase (NADPH) flavoprotein alpha-component